MVDEKEIKRQMSGVLIKVIGKIRKEDRDSFQQYVDYLYWKEYKEEGWLQNLEKSK